MQQPEYEMRWKLLLIVSLIAATVGAGLTLLLLFFFRSPILTALLFPAITTIYSSIFVYRHTARRRALQATLALLMTVFLIALIFFLTLRIVVPS
jgi:hypothetical protein